jgi:hypothetical protein
MKMCVACAKRRGGRVASTWWIQYAALEARLVGAGVGEITLAITISFIQSSLPREKRSKKTQGL